MSLFLFGHGGSGNHGCEAIVRSTAKLFSDHLCELYSFRPNEDRFYQLDTVCDIIDSRRVKVNKISAGFLRSYITLKFKHDSMPLDWYFEKCLFSQISSPNRVALSIGGDNYCYSKIGATRYQRYRQMLQARHSKTVLWGGSIEPALIDAEMRDDLVSYDLIVARESITFTAMKDIGANVILAPDPAFTLERRPGTYPYHLGNRPYIGLNVSPLVQGLEKGDDITLENYRLLLRWILQNTDRDIALIPHVVWPSSDDRVPLGQLYEEFKDTGRVFMVEDQNCMQLKDIISGCEFFVGARTHATIAAYSTRVPTLVVGYSVKARGIARDLFGTEEGYVLPVQQLKEKEDLTEAFKVLYARKDEIRNHLTDTMPGYIAGIQAAKEAVERL